MQPSTSTAASIILAVGISGNPLQFHWTAPSFRLPIGLRTSTLPVSPLLLPPSITMPASPMPPSFIVTAAALWRLVSGSGKMLFTDTLDVTLNVSTVFRGEGEKVPVESPKPVIPPIIIMTPGDRYAITMDSLAVCIWPMVAHSFFTTSYSYKPPGFPTPPAT